MPITFTDKIEDAGTTPTGRVSASEINEIKAVANTTETAAVAAENASAAAALAAANAVAAAAAKAPIESPAFTGAVSFSGASIVTGLVKNDVGLNNVNNTADANKPVSTAQAAAITAGAAAAAAGRVATGAIVPGLADETAADRATAGGDTLLGYTPAGVPLHTPLVTRALAAAYDLIAGVGEATVTPKTLADAETIEVLPSSSGTITVPWATLVAPDVGLHFRATVSAECFLRLDALPAGLAERSVRGSVLIYNTATTGVNIDLPVMIAGAAASLKTFDTLFAEQAWEVGSFALRTIPAGQQRLFEFRAHRGLIYWTARPVVPMAIPFHAALEQRINLTSVNLPVLSGPSWYSIYWGTWANVDAALNLPVVSNGSGISTDIAPNGVEQVDDEVIDGGTNMRFEGLIARGGNITFDSAPVTAQTRFLFVMRHNYRPVSVAACFGTGTFRHKSTSGPNTEQRWATAVLSGAQRLLVLQIARSASAAHDVTRRAELDAAFCVTRRQTSAALLGVTARPVTTWPEVTTLGTLNSEGVGFTIPILDA